MGKPEGITGGRPKSAKALAITSGDFTARTRWKLQQCIGIFQTFDGESAVGLAKGLLEKEANLRAFPRGTKKRNSYLGCEAGYQAKELLFGGFL